MSGSRLALVGIVLLFSMLWLPLGQQDFLIEHWMKLGTYAVPFLLIGMAVFASDRGRVPLTGMRSLSALMLVAYIVHQYEEHWIDLLGNYYAFYDYVNDVVPAALGDPDGARRPLTKEAIFVINTSLVWLVGTIAVWRSPSRLFPALALAGIVLVNGITHILGGLASQSYNPGLLTSILVFLPLSLFVFSRVLAENRGIRPQIAAAIVWAVLAHVVMVAGMLAANWYELIPERLYFLTLVLWSLLPLALFTRPARGTPRA